MRILITGGGGFVGSNLARHMASRGHSVIVYDNFSRQGSNSNIRLLEKEYPDVKFYRRELDDVGEFLHKEEVDIIYHFAAQVAVTTSYESPASDFRINALGTFNIVSNAQVPVIYASTNKVYGSNVNDIPVVEYNTRYDFGGAYGSKGVPEDFSIDAAKHTPYGCSKLVGDLYVREYGGVVNRFSCMYGQQQYGTVDQGWVSHFVLSKLAGKKNVIYGNGKQVRDLLHIDDVVTLLEQEAKNINKIRGEVFNVGGGYGNTLSLLELCEMLDIKPSYADWRPADQKVYYSDISKAKKILGWEPHVSKERGIAMLQEWAKSVPGN